MSQLPPIRTKRVTTHRTREGAQYWRRLLLGKGSVQATLPDSGSSSTQCQATCTSITAPASAAGQEICLSPLSQFFLNVENPPDIYAIMTLDGYCRLEELVQPMQHMADLHDRFRRRVVYRFGAWTAEMLEEFDVTTRMKEVTLDGCDAEQAFHDYMGQLMTHVPLGMDGFPPWDVWCIHYTSHPTRTDVLMRASHIIGDGQLFMKIIKQIMEPQDTTAAADYATTVLADTAAPGSSRSRCKETEAVSEPGEVDTEVRRSLSSDSSCSCSSGAYGSDSEASGGAYRADSSSSGSSSCGDLDSSNSIEIDDEQLQQQQVLRRKAAADCVVHLKPSIMQDSAKLEQQEGPQQQQQPQQQEQQGCQLPLQLQQQQQLQLRRRQRGIWQRVAQSLHVICRLLVMCWRGYTALIFTAILPFWFADPVTVVKASAEQCTGPRRWSSETIGLSDFYRTAKLLGHSINTLAVTCLAGGIRRYILRHGCRPARRVRLCSMVDTRSMPGLLTGTDGNSNNFSFIGVPLYTGDCSALERVTRVGAALSWIRHSLAVPLAIRMPSILQFIFRSPVWSTWAVLFCLPWKTTIGFSNMRGPAGRWSLSGHPVVRIHNGVQPMAFGCFVSLFSYGDTLTFTHTCYSTKTDKPQLLLTCLLEEYDSLRKAAALNVTIDSRQDTDPGSPGGRIKAA